MKERNFRRQCLRGAKLALLSGAAMLALPPVLHAQTTQYSSSRRQIKACVLVSAGISGANGARQNATPHLWYLLDRRDDVKPGGWEFVNPLASATVTGDLYLRWQTRGGVRDAAFINGTPEKAAFQIGAQLTKNMAPYWEVNLDTITDEDLRKFDIALISLRSSTAEFSPETRERLRRFVDGGGTLWLEAEDAGSSIGVNSPFLLPLRFPLGGIGGNVRPTIAAARHPIVQAPFALSQFDVVRVGASVGAHQTHQNPAGGMAAPYELYPVLWAGRRGNKVPYLSAADYGAGHLVISSAGIATAVTGGVGGSNVEGPNTGTISGTVYEGAQPTDLKIAYNIVSFGSNVPTSAVNSRRTGATPDKVGTQLGTKWATVPAAGQVGTGSGAVISKGIVYYVETLNGTSYLRAFDLNPATDLDGDGDGDDGIPDFRFGTPYDELWNVALPASRYSTPTVVTYFDTALGRNFDLVCVTDSTGKTLAYEGLPILNNGQINPNGKYIWTGQAAGAGDLLGGLGALAVRTPMPTPAVSEGVLFSIGYDPNSIQDAGEGWRIVPLDIITGRNVFDNVNAVMPPVMNDNLQPITSKNGLPAPLGAVTVGYVQDPGGALDKIAYVSTVPSNAGNDARSKAQGFIKGAWFSTRGEPLIHPVDALTPNEWTPIGARAAYPWYTGDAANPLGQILGLQPVIHGIRKDANGLITASKTFLYKPNAPGDYFNVQYTGGVGGNRIMKVIFSSDPVGNQTGWEFYADYTLDWTAETPGVGMGTTAPSKGEMRRLIRQMQTYTPASAGNSPLSLATGAPALSGQDTLIFANNFSDPNGNFATLPPSQIYSVKDELNNPAQPPVQPGAKVPTRRANGLQVAWMFSPYSPADANGVSFPDYPIRQRLTAPSTDLYTANNPSALSQFRAIGSPAVSNGVVYVTGTALNNGQQITVILALRSEPNLSFTLNTLTLPDPATGANQALVIRQPSFLKSQAGSPQYITLRPGAGTFTFDPGTRTVTLTNLREEGSTGNGLSALNLALPIEVSVEGVANPVFEKIIDPQTGLSKLDNLLWYLVIPETTLPVAGQKATRVQDFNELLTEKGGLPPPANGLYAAPASGPTVSGEVLYFGTQDGRVAAIDLKAMPSSGGAASLYDGERLRFSLMRVLEDPATGLPVSQPILYAPLASASTLAVGSPRGLAVLDSRRTLIADAGRLLEVDYANNAVVSIAGTRSNSFTGGAAGQDSVTSKTSFARPSIARRSRLNDFVVADTGNNRVVRTDQSGLSSWELRTFNDDFRITDGSVSLLAPSDVQATENGEGNPNAVFSIKSPVNGEIFSYTGAYYAVRYLIADTGNYRIVEIIDAYDPDGNPLVLTSQLDNTKKIVMDRQVVWATRTLSDQNKRLRFRTVQQFPNPTANNDLYLIASVDNVNTAATDVGGQAFGANGLEQTSVGGSLVAFRRYRPNETPVAPARDGDLTIVINSLVYGDPVAGTVNRRQPLNAPTYFRQFTVRGANNAPQSRYLVCDNSGAYVLRPVGKEAFVEWALTSDDYYRMTGRKLHASSLQKLPQSDYDPNTNKFYPRYLITNSTSGSDNIVQFFRTLYGVNLAGSVQDSEMHGEVIEIRSRDYFTLQNGYQNPQAALYRTANPGLIEKNPGSAIVWLSPAETLVTKNGFQSIQRKIGSEESSTFTYNLEQPAYSERQN